MSHRGGARLETHTEPLPRPIRNTECAIMGGGPLRAHTTYNTTCGAAGHCLRPPCESVWGRARGGWGRGQRPKPSLCASNPPPLPGPSRHFVVFPENNYSDVVFGGGHLRQRPLLELWHCCAYPLCVCGGGGVGLHASEGHGHGHCPKPPPPRSIRYPQTGPGPRPPPTAPAHRAHPRARPPAPTRPRPHAWGSTKPGRGLIGTELMWTNVEALVCAKCFLQFYGCHVPKCVHRTRAAGVLNAQRRDETRRQPTDLTRKYPQPSTRKPQHGAFYQSFPSFPRGGTKSRPPEFC